MEDRRKEGEPTAAVGVSASMYVGYVEEDECPEMIMRKFNAMEELREEGELTTAQLEELFMRTSSSRVVDLVHDGGGFGEHDDDFDFAGFVCDIMSEDDDDDDDGDGDGWESAPEPASCSSSSGGGGSGSGGATKRARRTKSKPSKRRRRRPAVAAAKQAAGRYVRLPAGIVQSVWGLPIRSPDDVKDDETSGDVELATTLHAANMWDVDLRALGRSFTGVLLNVPWDRVTTDELRALRVCDVVEAGLVFVWADKTRIAELLDAMETWDCRFVESLVWVRKRINNELFVEPSPLLGSAKRTLLICRRNADKRITLRHQRSADVVFDFVSECHDEPPQHVYNVIETMLPGGHLLELWAAPVPPGAKRSARWTRVES